MNSRHTLTHFVVLGILFGSLAVSCDHDHGHPHDHEDGHAKDEDDDHHASGGAHGGHLVDLGSAGHVEVVHVSETGSVTLHFTGPDAKAALAVDAAPELKLVTATGPRVIQTRASPDAPASSTFVATDEALHAKDLEGRISVVIGGKTFQPDL